MLDKNEFRKDAGEVIAWIDNYFNNLERLPVKAKVNPGEIFKQLPEGPPEHSESLGKVLDDLDKIIMPGITHWQHPNFHAYFPANSSIESLFGEMITAAIGAQCMIWDTSPAAAELEERTMNWLRDLIGLPGSFEGVIQDSASSATLVAILSAREKCTEFRSNEDGTPNNLRVYCSTETHSSVEKAVGIAGIGKKNLCKIAVDKQLSIQPQELENQIIQDLKLGLKPCCVVVSLGTTGTTAVDPLGEIAKICSEYDVWLHVDAAYAGSALVLPEYAWMIEGIDGVDSFVFNAHKWLFTNFDCSAYFVKNVDILIRTFEVLPEYLKTSSRGIVNDYRDWGVPLGRRFRALKLWFVLKGFGLEGIRSKLREHIRLSTIFVEDIKASKSFELVGKPFLNLSCFRYNPGNKSQEELNILNQKLVATLNERGILYVSHTKVQDKYAIRMVIGQTYIEERHVVNALQEIKYVTSEL